MKKFNVPVVLRIKAESPEDAEQLAAAIVNAGALPLRRLDRPATLPRGVMKRWRFGEVQVRVGARKEPV